MCSATNSQGETHKTQGINLVDLCEEILVDISKRRTIWKKKWRTWSITLYHGPALENDGNVISLEYTLLAKTKHASSEETPDLSTGCAPVRVSYKNTTIISWSHENLQTLQNAVTASFRHQLNM